VGTPLTRPIPGAEERPSPGQPAGRVPAYRKPQDIRQR
jgi:hypothetical protein